MYLRILFFGRMSRMTALLLGTRRRVVVVIIFEIELHFCFDLEIRLKLRGRTNDSL